MLGRNRKDKRRVPLALQIHEVVTEAIRSINVYDDDTRIVSVRCPDCKQMVRNRDYPTHDCIGGAA